MTLPAVAVDARMIEHSGIGIVLQSLFTHWSRRGSGLRNRWVVLGCPKALGRRLPAALDAEVIPWTPRIYSLGAAMAPPALPADVAAVYSPHYATSLAFRKPLVCHVQDVLHITHPMKAGTRSFMRGYLTALRRRAAFTLTTTRHVKVQLQTLYGFDAERVLCTGLGPGMMEFTEPGTGTLPEALRGREYLLAIGIYKVHKNWDFLLRRLAACPDVRVPLACLGLGRHAEELRTQAEGLGLGDRVIALPPVADAELAEVYRHARALLFPSIAEGFGLPILEAMHLGTPVLLADRSPMKEIGEGATCTFNPDWPETFDAGLRALLRDEDLRGRLQEAGRRRAAHFTWAKTARRIEDALLRAVTGELTPSENAPAE